MTRFQAQTGPALERELEELRERLGLRPNQKADLLRELATFASWIICQTEAGRTIEAHDDDDVQVFVHPILERLRQQSRPSMERIVLDDAEVERLAAILDQEEALTPALRETLRRIADPERKPPRLRWSEDG